MVRTLKAGVAALLVLGLGCAGVPREVPLEQWSPASKEEVQARLAGDRAPEILVMLAFSGGGTRAASFSHGVLQELAATKVTTSQGTHSLAHEVDVISSVSGGSFASAFFGLYGEGMFDEFEERFLRRNIEGALIAQLFNPVNWLKLMRSGYARSDLAAEYYGRHVFDHTTFADLNRPGAPLVIINSTDIGSGLRWPFFRDFFDLICADLDKYPISRAVAASSAVPGLLSPLGLQNYAGTCGYQPSEHLVGLASREGQPTRASLEARTLLEFADVEERPWLHLVDGGIADNLGVRAFYSGFTLHGGLGESFEDLHLTDTRHILLILVNSITHKIPEFTKQGRVPGLKEVLGSVSGIELARYDVDSIQLTRDFFGEAVRRMSAEGRSISFDFVDVNFEAVADEDARTKLNDVGTNFHLPDDEVDLLISAGREILRDSPDFKAFLDRIRKTGAAAP